MITVAVRTKTSIKFSELNNKTLFHARPGPERVVAGLALDSSYFVKPETQPLTVFIKVTGLKESGGHFSDFLWKTGHQALVKSSPPRRP